MIILGLDPGVGKIGFGVLRVDDGTSEAVSFGCIVTEKNSPLAERLWILEQDLKTLLKTWRPNACSLEKLYFSKNVKTALSVSHARGVILETLFDFGIPTFEYSPQEVKIAVTGIGNADKGQVQRMIERLLNVSIPRASDDCADALACAVCLSINNISRTQIINS